jgi:hypothetical protein
MGSNALPIEDHIEDIKELAKAGHPKIRSNSQKCDAPFVDLIGNKANSQLCLKWAKLLVRMGSNALPIFSCLCR